MRSLGLATDLLALGGAAEVEWRPGHLVVRTRGEPAFWSGNMVVVTDPPGDPEAEAALFRRTFPAAQHLRVAWDAPDLDAPGLAALRAAWAPLGAEVEAEDVLAREGPPPRREVPEGYVARALDPESDRDWAESLRLALILGAEEGYEAASHGSFLRRRVEARRAEARAGRLRWWGAFRGEEMAAQMGLVEGEVGGRRLGRFQEVGTHPVHRRRGLCAALLAQAGRAARASTLVILAEPGGGAGRIYARAGFERREAAVAAQRPGY